MTAFLMIFRRFPKIFQNCSEGQTNVPEHFPRISENFRRLPKTFEEDPKMFRWYTNEFQYNLRDKLDITEVIDIFTCEDISSHVRISYRFYQFVTTRYTTDFYIIKNDLIFNLRISRSFKVISLFFLVSKPSRNWIWDRAKYLKWIKN